MAVRNLQSITPTYWVPPTQSANWRMTVERTDGTIDDISDIIVKASIEDGVTEGIGKFEFTIWNPGEYYTSIWTGMEIFRYYSDYAATATTLRFRGRIEKPSNKNYQLQVTGRSETLFVHGQTIYKDYEDKDAGYIIKDLFDTYGESRFDTSSIDTSTGITLDFTFNGYAFWDAIEAVCLASSYDCYVNCSLVVQFFEAGTKLNTKEGIVHDFNLVEVGDFAPDLTFIKNKIRVVGGNIDGVQVMYTANDTASQTTNGIRMDEINDDGIITMDAAKEYGEYLLSNQKDPPTVGEVRSFQLATIQPGENIRMSAPSHNISPGNYRTILWKLDMENGMGYTTVTLNKEPKKLSHILKSRIQREHRRTNASENPNDLDFAEIELFNTDVGTHSDTLITDGVLQVSFTKSSGTWTSPVYATVDSKNVSQMRISPVGTNIPNISIKISVDNGLTYQDADRDELVTVTGTGSNIKIKLALEGTTTQVDSLKIQYSTV